jgi:hypothetical protein
MQAEDLYKPDKNQRSVFRQKETSKNRKEYTMPEHYIVHMAERPFTA